MRGHNEAFRRLNRLSHPQEFNRVYASSLRAAQGPLRVIACRNNGRFARLGLAVSRKEVPGAVARNRFKRLTRECFRRNQALLKGLDVVVCARGNVRKYSSQGVLLSLQTLFQRIAAWKGC